MQESLGRAMMVVMMMMMLPDDNNSRDGDGRIKLRKESFPRVSGFGLRSRGSSRNLGLCTTPVKSGRVALLFFFGGETIHLPLPLCIIIVAEKQS